MNTYRQNTLRERTVKDKGNAQNGDSTLRHNENENGYNDIRENNYEVEEDDDIDIHIKDKTTIQSKNGIKLGLDLTKVNGNTEV